MNHLSHTFLISLLLVILIATPVAVSAQNLSKVYADSTGSAGNGTGPQGGPTNPVRINSQADFDTAINLLANRTGTLVYIFKTSGVQWCEYTITNGVWGPPRNCTPGYPPETGLAVAMASWWVLGAVAAVALVAAGLFLRRRSSARA